MYSSPVGKATLVFMAPFLALAMAIAVGATTLEAVTEKASCVMECSCACNYAIGAAALWVLAMQSAYKSGPVSLPKSEEAVPPTVMPERMAKALDAKGKVAAKAA